MKESMKLKKNSFEENAMIKNSVIPMCPRCGSVYEHELIGESGTARCEQCASYFKYCRIVTYTTELTLKEKTERPR